MCIHLYIFARHFPKRCKARVRMSSTAIKKLIPSVLRGAAQWRFQHPNETRCILLWLVILDPSLFGLRTPRLDFADLRSSVQPFAAGSTPPLWPAWQNSQRGVGQYFLCPVRPFSLICRLYHRPDLQAFWENPKLNCSHIILVIFVTTTEHIQQIFSLTQDVPAAPCWWLAEMNLFQQINFRNLTVAGLDDFMPPPHTQVWK